MTLSLRISNLLAFLRKSETARTGTEIRPAEARLSARRTPSEEEFRGRATADEWQFACSQRTFR